MEKQFSKSKCSATFIHLFLNLVHWADTSFCYKYFQQDTPKFPTDCCEWRQLLVLSVLKSLQLIIAITEELAHRKNVAFAKLQSFLSNMPTEWPEVPGGQSGIKFPLND